MRDIFRKAFPKTTPVLAGYVFLGIAYGVAMRARGFSALWSVLCSVFVYGGSMQFALIEPLTLTFAPVTIALLTVLIHARHIFYGISMLERYQDTGKYKPYLILSLTDETYSLVCNGAPADVDAAKWYTCVSLLDQIYWVAGTLLGAVLGSLLPTSYLTGIDFSMTALFVVIATEQSMDSWRQWKAGTMSAAEALFAPLLGFGATLLSLIVMGTGSFLLLAMGLMLAAFSTRWLCVERGRFVP